MLQVDLPPPSSTSQIQASMAGHLEGKRVYMNHEKSEAIGTTERRLEAIVRSASSQPELIPFHHFVLPSDTADVTKNKNSNNDDSSRSPEAMK